MDLTNVLLNGMTSKTALDSISRKTGGSQDQISGLISSALPLLMSAVTQNASTQEGASSLLGALSQHTSTAPVEEQVSGADVDDGMKIISHILGNNSSAVMNSLSSSSGLDLGQVSSVLGMIAPAILSLLSTTMSSQANSFGKIDLSDGLDLKDAVGLLGMVLGGGNKPQQNNAGSGLLGLLGGLLKGK